MSLSRLTINAFRVWQTIQRKKKYVSSLTDDSMNDKFNKEIQGIFKPNNAKQIFRHTSFFLRIIKSLKTHLNFV